MEHHEDDLTPAVTNSPIYIPPGYSVAGGVAGSDWRAVPEQYGSRYHPFLSLFHPSLLPSLHIPGDDVCGVSVRIRGFDQNVIQIWNMDSELHTKSSVRNLYVHV